MAITIESMVNYALYEYERDTEFRGYVDRVLGQYINQGKLKKGMLLRDLLSYEVEDETIASLALQAFHTRISLDQYSRARKLSENK